MADVRATGNTCDVHAQVASARANTVAARSVATQRRSIDFGEQDPHAAGATLLVVEQRLDAFAARTAARAREASS